MEAMFQIMEKTKPDKADIDVRMSKREAEKLAEGFAAFMMKPVVLSHPKK